MITKPTFFILSLVISIGVNFTALADATNSAVMQALDKVTARVSTFDVPLGGVAIVGALSIKLYHCDKTPPEEAPESAAFIEVIEEKRGEEPVNLFNGWMFASSPALSSIEHPVYDVWVLECVNRADTSLSENLSSESDQ